MKRANAEPHNKTVFDAVVERIRSMTADEALAFLTKRSPGIEETDVTGMFAVPEKPARKRRQKRATETVDLVVVR